MILKESIASLNQREMRLLLIWMILIQIADGILTWMGIERMGVHAEGNSLLRASMFYFGPAATLAFVKSQAILLIFGLVLLSNRLSLDKNSSLRSKLCITAVQL